MQRLSRLSDATLIERSRERNTHAFAELWRRHHKAGLVAARSFAPGLDADDLVSESFEKILGLLVRGSGPSGNFRPYLYTVVRNTAIDTFRRSEDEISAESLEGVAGALHSSEDMVEQFNNSVTKQAFESLPVREQEVLWLTEVEGLAPRKAAPMLGISAGATSALAMRARNRLRIAWLSEHAIQPSVKPACAETIDLLPSYTKGILTGETLLRVQNHLQSCESCSQLLQDAERMYARPGAAVALAVLGAGFAGALNLKGIVAVPVAASLLLGGGYARVAIAAAAVIAVIVAGSIAAGMLQSGGHAERPGSGEHTTGQQGGGSGKAPQPEPEQSIDSGGSDSAPPPNQGSAPSGDAAEETSLPLVEQPSVPQTPGTNPAPAPGPTPIPTPKPPTPPIPPSEPTEPPVPDIVDDLPQTLEPLIFSPLDTEASRLALVGTGAEPGATVRLLVTTQPTAGGATYGSELSTRAGSTGYWSFNNVGGITPLNATVKVQQFTKTEASPWVTVAQDVTFPIEIQDAEPSDFNGVYSWFVRGWPKAHWALREVGEPWPYSAGQLTSSGSALVPVPGDVGPGETRVYEIGYWAKGRFEPFGPRVIVTG